MSIKQSATGLYHVMQNSFTFAAFATLREAVAYCSLRKIPYVVEV